MRIAFNAMQVRAAKSGVGQYIEGLLDGLLSLDGEQEERQRPDITTYCSPENEPNYVRDGQEHYRTRVWGVREGRKALRLFHEMMRLGHEVSGGAFDLFHGPSNFLPFRLRIPSVVTIHDLSYYVEPERCPFLRRQYWYAMTRHTIRAAHRIIADSENTRRDLARFFPGSESKTRVVPLGVHPRFMPPRPEDGALSHSLMCGLGLSASPVEAVPYILSVCTLEPGKNLGLLVSAFDGLAAKWPELKLVLVGDKGWKFEPLLQQIEASPFRDRILLPGHLPDQDIVKLMQACRVFAYPSRYEGFGLPPLEALACGAPVVASTGGSLGEVLAGLPGVSQCSPQDLSGFQSLLEGSLGRASNPPPDREAWAEAVRRRYSWERTARMTAEIWREVLER